jgi:branched-chain amino acid transport system ATP-binding protein
MGRHIHLAENFISCLVFRGPARTREIDARRRVEEILELMDLGRYRREPVGNLPYGKQKLVEIARALAMEPRLLLLDEPTSGMTHDEKQTVADVMLEIQATMKVTQVLIEHDVKLVSDLCDRIVVLDFGRCRAEGVPAQVLAEPEVIAAYIGAPDS